MEAMSLRLADNESVTIHTQFGTIFVRATKVSVGISLAKERYSDDWQIDDDGRCAVVKRFDPERVRLG